MLRRVSEPARIRANEAQGGTWDAFFWSSDVQSLHAELAANGADVVYADRSCRKPTGCASSPCVIATAMCWGSGKSSAPTADRLYRDRRLAFTHDAYVFGTFSCFTAFHARSTSARDALRSAAK